MNMPANIIDGKKLADSVYNQIALLIKLIDKAYKKIPRLVSLQASSHPSDILYVNAQKKNAEKAGLFYESLSFDHNVVEGQFLKEIHRLNKDDSVNGIIVQLPLPKPFNVTKVVEAIDPSKDVEGVHPYNQGKLMFDPEAIVPPTARAVMEIINSRCIEIRGKECVVVGDSKIAGRPISLLLLNKLATVTVCNIGTGLKRLEEHVKRAELLVVAAGVPGLIKGNWLKEGAVVIDVGINVLPKGKVVGDVEFEEAKQKALFITPVPGGVGPVTTAMLLMNCLDLFEKQRNLL